VLVIVGIVYICLMSFFVRRGVRLHGRADRRPPIDPLSGVGILRRAGSGFASGVRGEAVSRPVPRAPALVAYALFVTSVVFCAATISNDNLQDLKTGQLVDATPWRQQVALIVGVVAGAIIIPPILDLLNHAYGFAGARESTPRARSCRASGQH